MIFGTEKHEQRSGTEAVPKYSVVLPTLNGRDTLCHTLPAMLELDRADVEWVISDNLSDDGTYQWLRNAITDERVRIVQPRHRLSLGEHLEFAYRHARGEWQTHIGDDDMLLPWRFQLLDRLLKQYHPQVVKGEVVRYLWPGYPDRSSANSLDRNQVFRRCESMVAGPTLAKELVNTKVVYAGGAWTIHRSIIDKIRHRCGWFASPQHVEFFAMRAAACLGKRVVITGEPLMILGRHEQSSGIQAYLPKRLIRNKTWNWEIEDPLAYEYCPFPWKSYSTLSLDAALAIKSTFTNELDDTEIDWKFWGKQIHEEVLRLKRNGQLPRSTEQRFWDIATQLSLPGSAHWRTNRMQKSVRRVIKATEAPVKYIRNRVLPRKVRLIESQQAWGWKSRVHGASAGFDSIDQVPNWLADRFADNRERMNTKYAA